MPYKPIRVVLVVGRSILQTIPKPCYIQSVVNGDYMPSLVGNR